MKTENQRLFDYAMLAEASYGDFSGNQVNLYYDLQKENKVIMKFRNIAIKMIIFHQLHQLI